MERLIEIPKGIEVFVSDNNIRIKGPAGELSRDVNPDLKLGSKENKIILASSSDRRKILAVLGTENSHIKNMLVGVVSGWEARLKAVYSHFPVKITKEGSLIVIKNFMGERNSRIAHIVGDSDVEIKKDDLIITGLSRYDVGQTAANIELITKVKGFDRRVFQDGCHLTEKTHPRQLEKTAGKD